MKSPYVNLYPLARTVWWVLRERLSLPSWEPAFECDDDRTFGKGEHVGHSLHVPTFVGLKTFTYTDQPHVILPVGRDWTATPDTPAPQLWEPMGVLAAQIQALRPLAYGRPPIVCGPGILSLRMVTQAFIVRLVHDDGTFDQGIGQPRAVATPGTRVDVLIANATGPNIPCPEERAVGFGRVHCQIDHGDHAGPHCWRGGSMEIRWPMDGA